MTQTLLIVIPCLNEATHIGALLDQLCPAAARLGARIVVADGGSTDGTLAIVGERQKMDPCIVLLHNEKRIQSAAINLAVAKFGEAAQYFIRIDAHGGYPDDYCDRLVEEAQATGADSVVVSMLTSGSGTVQKAAAAAQNSKLGTGGSKHRHLSAGEWVDHGHHALMRISAFRAVGGYDEAFSHNEDAELDYRLRQAGYRIWMSGRTQMVYYPRSSLRGLYFQYLGYGRGRAKNVLKHRVIPKVRQMVPLAVFPVVVLAAFSFVHWIAALPLLLWVAVCLGYGLVTAISQRNADSALAGVSAMVMHFGWSVGFWLQLLGLGARRRAA
ncbi:glycosyltransferase family 2 protein [Mesorhizobium sp. ES1-4]|uniref:glycosyltransferase family 2 protein n=1 Tax=Mesorhizobium sp. ES1-4 TaxID=2876627 RepID=UPI001CCEC8B2|nr:glycosyltransferase family 2 protein [Mesorhizobium sp. ES1-4]MBZ9798846.1 glycosyltransferase family 2 protein [Mesorhizobium sp. ES1-4]